MRLTLRTLLAYLDDRLPPANARELGQKIVKSPFATELADRIKSVVRRRRLAAESGDKKSIDANLIAEYLDDQLTPELVALIEKEILGSDHSLAEVAAVHQILGLLHDPVEISDRLSARLHKLDPAVESKADGTADVEQSAEWKPLAPQTASARRSPMVLLLLMVVGWLADFSFTDADLFDRKTDLAGVEPPAGQDVEADVPDAQPAVNGVDNTNATAVAQNGPAATPPASAKKAEPKASENLVAANVPATAQPGVNSTAGNEPTATVPAITANGSTPLSTTPAASSPVTASTDGTAPMKADVSDDIPKAAPDAANVPVQVPEFEVRDDNRMHLLHDPASDEWGWAIEADADPVNNWGQRMSDGVSAVANPFRLAVAERRAGWTATIPGASLFRTVNGQIPGIELFDGRLVLQRTNATEAKQFSLVASGRLIHIAIPQDDDQVGISVEALPGKVPAAESRDGLSLFPFGSPAIVRIFAADNSVMLNVEGNEQPIEIERGKSWQWNTAEAVPTVSPVTPSPLVPAWVYNVTESQPDATQTLHEEAADAFRSESTIAGAANVLSKNKNDQLAAYGVQLSGLTRNVDQLTSFLLQQPNGEVVRREAIAGLRMVIQQSSAGHDRVQAALETRLSKAELDNAMKMLAGVSRISAEDRFVSSWLVEMLSSNRVALREMAIVNLEELTNERYAFFSDDDAGRRSSAVRRWERFVDRNDGRLVKPVE